MREELASYGHGLADKQELVVLTKADALAPEQIKEQAARLKRAAKSTPLVLSAHSHEGVTDALRRVLAMIDGGRAIGAKAAERAEAWHP